jgi:hypothetical protein
MIQDLPEGISVNRNYDGDLEVELPFEIPKEWNCKKCELSFETLLIGTEGRYSGRIITSGNNAITWQGPLPKVKEKAIKFLKENLDKKVARHLERH